MLGICACVKLDVRKFAGASESSICPAPGRAEFCASGQAKTHTYGREQRRENERVHVNRMEKKNKKDNCQM
jgi:hypothetical protein